MLSANLNPSSKGTALSCLLCRINVGAVIFGNSAVTSISSDAMRDGLYNLASAIIQCAAYLPHALHERVVGT
jgi:hypothetical protein